MKIKLGILGGGQLAQMLIMEAIKLGIEVYVLDPDENCPASNWTKNFIKGDFRDFNACYNFCKMVDVLTIEIEQVNVDALEALKNEGLNVNPSPEAVRIIQDKNLQKEFYLANKIPTSNFKYWKNESELINSIKSGELRLPVVQKDCKFGYDGKGVSVINSIDDISRILPGESITEEKIKIWKEISVIACKDYQNDIKTFDPVEMVFDERANLVDYLKYPANISEELSQKCKDLAIKTVLAFDSLGIFAVEMFIDEDNNVLVNEVAPRPHNSGHQTIECVVTSQYQQHLRSILGLPLGSTELRNKSIMINIIGESEEELSIKKYKKLLDIDGVNVHLYGKIKNKPLRKMGHISIESDSEENLKLKFDQIKFFCKSI